MATDTDVLASLHELPGTLRSVQAALTNVTDPVVFNDSSGHLVLSRYQPVLTGDARAAGVNRIFEDVDSDVGRLTFPRFDRFILPAVRTMGCWEPEECAFLRAHLRPGMCVLDVGANVGYSALVMAKAVGEAGLVLAVEPEPLNYELLCRNLHRNGARNVLPVHTAAGDVTGSITLERSPDNPGDHRTAPHPLGVGSVEVPLVALDDLLGADLPVGFVMIDAQGYDHRVVRGLASTIARCRPPMLLEYWPLGILSAGDDAGAVLEEYRSYGYRLQLLSGQDVSAMSAEEILTFTSKDHVSIVLDPA